MIRDEFVKSGHWLFRWRSYTPLILAAVLLASLQGFTYPMGSHALDQVWDFCCYGLALLGLTIRVLTVGFVPRDTSGRNTAKGQVATRLNTTGIYSLLRHPLYFSNFWMWMGVAVFPRVWWVPVLMMLVYFLVYERIISAEEDFLAEKFGDEYVAWANKTPIMWPRFRNWVRPDLPFSWRAVLRRENSTFLGMTTIFFILEMMETWEAEG